jgi:hypothetical protein
MMQRKKTRLRAAPQQIRYERRARAQHEQCVGLVHLGLVAEYERMAQPSSSLE